MKRITFLFSLLLISVAIGEEPVRDKPQGHTRSYLGITKLDLVNQVGLPAEIDLPLSDEPAHEVWTYYWRDRSGAVHAAKFGFRNRIVISSTSNLNPSAILSTNSETDLADIFRFKRIHPPANQ